MNINKSKVTLAAKIKSSGFEWPQFGKWATQDKDGEVFISGGEFTPVRRSGEVNWCFDVPYKSAGKVEFGVGWFQCILSRAEYFHLYPAPDADWWIEWKGGECPVEKGTLVDVRFKDGMEMVGAPAGQTPDHFPRNMTAWARSSAPGAIIAYRLHKQQPKPEFCESVMRSIPEPTAKPTIEQLATDYRKAKDYAERKQQEADAAKNGADAKLKALELAGEAHGLLVSPITVKQEPELVITDWRQWRVGDVVSWSLLNHAGEFEIISVHHDQSRNIGDFEVKDKQGGVYRVYGNECGFIRRP